MFHLTGVQLIQCREKRCEHRDHFLVSGKRRLGLLAVLHHANNSLHARDVQLVTFTHLGHQGGVFLVSSQLFLKTIERLQDARIPFGNFFGELGLQVGAGGHQNHHAGDGIVFGQQVHLGHLGLKVDARLHGVRVGGNPSQPDLHSHNHQPNG